jgi:predicted nucleic acid-binding protein
MFILDTHVVSELRKVKAGKADRHVAAWAASVPADALFVSAISILELETGVLRVLRRDPGQGALLREWLDRHVLPAFSGRVLPVDMAVARQCAALHVPDPRSDRDALIAATAIVHRMTVVTRDVADFAPTGVPVLDPWQPAKRPRGAAGRPGQPIARAPRRPVGRT